ncbi:uncharacterized protein LOC106717173 [Papilio machaon]|uniref:uncharacterized protein LOC106717173 n=1 Tax=Papilio machaon TaxID=76193 RepID=UPI001E663DAC|nr:uncharacterized protein LOC106717173 [Papilio machaon]
MAPSRTSVLGVLTTIQALILMMFSIFFILNAYCYIDFFQDSIIGVLIKIMYLHDPGLCGTNINIGELVDGMPNQAFVRMQQAPFTYYRTLYINWANFAVAILWLIANELMFRNCAMFPWVTITLSACLLDFSALLMYLNDFYATEKLPDLLSYIGANAFGTGMVVLDTTSVAPVMSLIMSKGTVFIIINSALIMWHSLNYRERNDNLDAEAATPSPTGSPLHFARSSIRMPRHLPRPNLYRNDRFVTALKLRDIGASSNSERASRPLPGLAIRELATVLPHPDPTPTPKRPERAFSAEDLRRIRVPDTILSLPQRLEKLIADEARKFEVKSSDSSENGFGDRNERTERSQAGGVGRGLVFFPELALTLPKDLEQTMTHQKRCLDIYTFHVHPKYNDPFSTSLPNLTDGIQFPVTNELYLEYKAWLRADYIAKGAAPWRAERGYNSRLRKQLRPRTDPHHFNVTRQAGSMFREASVDHLAWTGSGKLRRLVFSSSQRAPPDVLY